MNENVFRRVEQKYILTKKQKEALMKKINKNIEKDKFFISEINNIYFDNDNNEMITASIEKPVFKKKVRLRSYDVPGPDSEVFLEIKEKYEGVVGKRRISLKLKDFNAYYEKGKSDGSQIMKELDYYFKMYDLKPMTYVGYHRESYKAINEFGLRITFDNKLRSRDYDLKLDAGDHGEQFFDDYIMEIKTLGSIPMWLVRNLSELKIYPKSFSKIGNIYSKGMSDESC